YLDHDDRNGHQRPENCRQHLLHSDAAAQNSAEVAAAGKRIEQVTAKGQQGDKPNSDDQHVDLHTHKYYPAAKNSEKKPATRSEYRASVTVAFGGIHSAAFALVSSVKPKRNLPQKRPTTNKLTQPAATFEARFARIDTKRTKRHKMHKLHKMHNRTLERVPLRSSVAERSRQRDMILTTAKPSFAARRRGVFCFLNFTVLLFEPLHVDRKRKERKDISQSSRRRCLEILFL